MVCFFYPKLLKTEYHSETTRGGKASCSDMLTWGREHRTDQTPISADTLLLRRGLTTPLLSPLSPQELEFASRLVKQSQVSTEVLLEALRLLLPTLPESELLSVVDALCRPKHSAPSAPTEPARPGYASVLTVLVKEPVNPKPFLSNVVHLCCTIVNKVIYLFATGIKEDRNGEETGVKS